MRLQIKGLEHPEQYHTHNSIKNLFIRLMTSHVLYQKYNFLPADGRPLPPLLFLLHRKSKSNSKTKHRLTEKSKTKANSEYLPTLAAKTMETARVASNTQHYVLSPHLLYEVGAIGHYHPRVGPDFLGITFSGFAQPGFILALSNSQLSNIKAFKTDYMHGIPPLELHIICADTSQ